MYINRSLRFLTFFGKHMSHSSAGYPHFIYYLREKRFLFSLQIILILSVLRPHQFSFNRKKNVKFPGIKGITKEYAENIRRLLCSTRISWFQAWGTRWEIGSSRRRPAGRMCDMRTISYWTCGSARVGTYGEIIASWQMKTSIHHFWARSIDCFKLFKEIH